MDDFIASSSRWRIALYLVGALAFVMGGLMMTGWLGEPLRTERYSPETTVVIGWAVVVLFGACAAGFVRLFFGEQEQLRINSIGVRWAKWSNDTIPWGEIEDVSTWTFKRQTAIILHLKDPSRYPGTGPSAWFAAQNRRLTGGDVSISTTTTDQSTEAALSAIKRFWPQSRGKLSFANDCN